MNAKDLRPLPVGTEAGWHPDPDSLLRDRWWTGTGWTDRTRSGLKPSPEALAESGDPRGLEPWTLVSVTSAETLPGLRSVEHLGEAFGVTVRSRNMLSDFGAGLRNLVGGEVRAYSDMLRTAHREAVDRLREDAHDLGANAVVAMRMTANSMVDGVVEIVAYGAAVRVVDDTLDVA
jgi:uncharacterized protein YbjQ (UPF0145 family)